MVTARQGSWLRLIYIVLVSALGGFLFGYDSGVISGCEKAIQWEYSLTGFQHGFTVSVALIGTVLGAFTMGRPSDKYGRKAILLLMAILYLVSAVGCAFATNWLMLVIMRGIGGVAIGGSSVIVPIYIVEIVPGKYRGRLVMTNQLNIVLGILVSYIANFYIDRGIDQYPALLDGCRSFAELFTSSAMAVDSLKWRLMLGVETFPALLFFVLLFTIPESPRWLVRAGKREEAIRIFQETGDVSAEETVHEVEQTLHSMSQKVNVRLFQKKYFMPIFLAWAISMFNQLAGINAINYYAPRIFENFMGTSSALAATIGVGTVNMIFTIVAFCLIDSFGRRGLLMVGAIGTTVMHFITAWQIGQGEAANPTLIIGAILGFIAFFGMSQGACMWVFVSEIFPNVVRAKGQALASFTHWFMCTLISWSFPVIAGVSGSWAFWFFGSMTLLQFFFVWQLMPETKGGTIEQIEKRWETPSSNEAA